MNLRLVQHTVSGFTAGLLCTLIVSDSLAQQPQTPTGYPSRQKPRFESVGPPPNPGPANLTPSIPIGINANIQPTFPAFPPLPLPSQGLTTVPTAAVTQPQYSMNIPTAPSAPVLSPTMPNAVAANAPINVASNPSASSTMLTSAVTEGPSEPTIKEFDAGDLIAVVGEERVLAGDMLVFIEPIIEKNREKISKRQEAEVRASLTRQALKQYVEVKAMYQEFFRDVGGGKAPKEIADVKKQILTKISQMFYEKQLPTMYEKYQVSDTANLERKLRENSMSIATVRTQFIERVLGNELEKKYVHQSYEFSREELYEYYLNHKEKWNVSGRSRWRQLTARKSGRSRDEAVRLINEMGNEVYLGGKPFDAVAKSRSEGYTANEGGLHDWTTQDSLKSAELNQAIFALPLRSLSQVIEDEVGFHIIEVLEREEGHVKSFEMAQPEIRELLTEQRQNKELDAFRAKVMARTTIWTLWPEDIPNSRPLSAALGPDYNSPSKR